MAGSFGHRWYFHVLVLLSILLGAAAAVVQASGGKGPWALGLAIAAAVTAAFGGILEKVVAPQVDAKRLREQEAEAQRQREEVQAESRRKEDQRARAVELMLMSGDGQTSLAVINQYRHEVTEIRVECWPLGGAPGGSEWPAFVPGGASDHVTYDVIAGGGQVINVARIAPTANPATGTGLGVGAWQLLPGGVTEMEFTVDWLDHERRGRRLWGVADLTNFVAITTVDLNPPESLTTEPP